MRLSLMPVNLRALDTGLTSAWREAFEGIRHVDIQAGDILESAADAIVSPANSFGYMDGGIDLVYRNFFGAGFETRLQEQIQARHDGELPVGQAIILATGHEALPFLIAAPTRSVPTNVSETINAYLAFRAALPAVQQHNALHGRRIRSLLWRDGVWAGRPADGRSLSGGHAHGTADRGHSNMAAALRATAIARLAG